MLKAISCLQHRVSSFQNKITDSYFGRQYQNNSTMMTFLIALASDTRLEIPFLLELSSLFENTRNTLRATLNTCTHIIQGWMQTDLDKTSIFSTLINSCKVLFCTVNSCGRTIIQSIYFKKCPVVLIDEG